MLVGDAFDLEARIFEIEEKGCLEAGNVEIAEHLGEVAVVECSNDFGIDDHQIIHDQIGNEGANVVACVTDDEFPLNIAPQTLLGEFDDKCAFVKLFIETWFEGKEHLVGGSDDHFG